LQTGSPGILTRQFYDDYSFTANPLYNFDTTLAFHAKNNRVRGMSTGSMTRVMNNDNTIQWLTSVLYYDKYGRAIQSISDNHLGGVDIVSNQYNFAGELLKTLQVHRVPGNPDITIAYSYVYDTQGRLLQTWQKINRTNPILVTNWNIIRWGR
jgi:hypothetical protein